MTPSTHICPKFCGRHFPASILPNSGLIRDVVHNAREPSGLSAMVCEPGAVSSSSSRRAVGGVVDINEGCMLTKSVKYAHRHWVNAVRGGDSSEVVSTNLYKWNTGSDPISQQEELIEKRLHITPYPNFSVDAPCNPRFYLAFRKSEGFIYRTHLNLSSWSVCPYITVLNISKKVSGPN